MTTSRRRAWRTRLCGWAMLISFMNGVIWPSVSWANSPERQSFDAANVETSPEPEAVLGPQVEDAATATRVGADESAVRQKGDATSVGNVASSDGRVQVQVNPDDVSLEPRPEQTESAEAPALSTPPGTQALPSGADKSGVTSQAISIPKGSGTIKGMEESFSAQLSTGIATFSVPFAIPAARGGAQASLGLSYSSSSGLGLAGMGWDVGVPFVSRQTDRGLPKYDDRASFHAEQDRFVFNGGQELVPICTVAADLNCAGALTGEKMPPWSKGHQYFRPRVEGSFLRFFWSPNHKTWRVQDKSGVTMELGVPLDGSDDMNALERNPEKACESADSCEIYKWGLVRQYDTYGDANPASGNPAPNNVVVYKYFQDGGMAYVSDIFHTTPAANPSTTATAAFAHHVRLVYENRTDATQSYRSGWLIEQQLRLKHVDVASKPFNGDVDSERHQVRRYHLSYDPSFHASYLESVQVEGRCDGDEMDAPGETSQALPETTDCARLPAMTFAYSHVMPFTVDGEAGGADLTGYEGFDERLRSLASSPDHSVDEELADLFDINSDALPDVLVTAPGVYNDNHAVFFNSPGGIADKFGGPTEIKIKGVLGADANTIKLSNPNVAALDIDGDGEIDLLHMPKQKKYAVYKPEVDAKGNWSWVGRAIATASAQNVKIDFGSDVAQTKEVDVNFDGLVDVVVSTGTEFQTFFALGRYPGGDGQFGSATRTDSGADISNDEVATCVPWSSTPVQFSDSDIQLAEMNGDGIPDIVRIRRGDIQYWPGRGNGVWGTGQRDDCPAGTFSSNRYVEMDASPYYSDIQGTTLRVDDVNGDGLDDLVQVRYDAVDVWLNVDGKGWTERHIIDGTPASPSYAIRVRLTDVNGSGTRDVLWGNAEKYQYMDLTGGTKPGLLVRVENGLGKSTDLEYGTSTSEMLAADANGGACSPDKKPWASPWCSKMPLVTHLVKRVTENDNLNVAGLGNRKYTTEYSYRDPVYEGRQREFRGFRKAKATRIGDANSPTDITETSFLLGECEDETVGDRDNGVDDCAVSERWRDNPKEALKGLPVLTERYDESGVFLSTVFNTYRLRELYQGLDGRAVRHAFQSATGTYLYDTALGPATSSSTVSHPMVELETEFDSDPLTEPTLPVKTLAVPVRAPTNHALIESRSLVDFFGNQWLAVALGCNGGDACVDDETISSYTRPSLVPNNETDWLWRTVESYVTGSVNTDPRKHATTTYTAKGDPDTTSVLLKDTVLLDRFHVAGRDVAPTPADASEEGALIVASQKTYDPALGTLTKETGANDRCRTIGYDSVFASLPTLETIYTGADCTNPLSTSAAYDRGLGIITQAVDMQGQPTAVQYDELGRLSALFRPEPEAASSSTTPSVAVEYMLPSNENGLRYSRIHTKTQDGADSSSTEYLESWAYVDGFGRTLVTLAEADPSAGDGGAWIAGSFLEYDAKSAVRRKYLNSFYDGEPAAFPLTSSFTGPYGRQRYDAFGRQLQTFDLDGTVTLQSVYHALSTDLWDAADLEPGPHQGTPASERKDGHGRTVAVVERTHEAGSVEAREVQTQYLATGEPEVITRVRIGKSDAPVVRWMRYDTLGRMVLNVEPNTSKNFTTDVNANATPSVDGLKAWRYVYNDAGDLVGTSDARGCGVNFAYDATGRLLSEDYSPCELHHPAYSPPSIDPVDGPSGIEVLYHYDTVPGELYPGLARPAGLYVADRIDPAFFKGRLVAVFDRGSATWTSYDGRGRAIQSAVQVAKPVTAPPPDDTGTLPSTPDLLASRYAEHAYIKSFAFDAADREVASSTGAEISELQGAAAPGVSDKPWFDDAHSSSVVTTQYTKRGTVRGVDGSYGSLIAKINRDADGLINELVYGDSANTTTASSYDNRRRLRSVQTYRGPPSSWSSPPTDYLPQPAPGGAPTTFQLLLQDEDYTYDAVNNPAEIRDWRNAEEWPDGAKPVTKKVQYDDLYRVTRVDYEYSAGDALWVSPFAAENSGDANLQDQRRAQPTPHVDFANRILWQSFKYDWLGNTEKTDDDARGFYDRSLGAITNDTVGDKPYQLKSATNAGGNPSTREGSLATAYDDAGNLTRLDVARSGPCLPNGAKCSQRFDYQWDEVGRLTRARRWDVPSNAIGTPTDALPSAPAAADLNYVYDAGDQRTLKTAFDDTGNASHSAYIFDSLELRRGTFDSTDFEQSSDTEVAYLSAHGVRLGRLEYEAQATPTVGDAKLHVLLELGDHLGSTSIVIDKVTSELVERSTYQAYGAAESDYRPERWKGFREDYRFTGKEEDVEVGLQYFGKRYLNPLLGRWASADPLVIESPAATDGNLYAYVRAHLLKNIDPLGLEEVPAVHTSQGRSYESFTKAMAPIMRAKLAAYMGIRPDQVRKEVVAAMVGQLGAESTLGKNVYNHNWGNVKASKEQQHFYLNTPEYFGSEPIRDAQLRSNPYYGGEGYKLTDPLTKKPGIMCTGKTDCTRFVSFSEDSKGLEKWFDHSLKAGQRLQANLVLNEIEGKKTSIDDMAQIYKDGLKIRKWDEKKQDYVEFDYSSSSVSTYAATIRNHLKYVPDAEPPVTDQQAPSQPQQQKSR